MKMQDLIREKIIHILKHIHNSSKYADSLKKCLIEEMNDIIILYIWKYFILFCYEKYYQILHIGNEKEIEFYEKYLKKNNAKVNSIKKKQLFWPNQLDDDIIIGSLKDIYMIDANVVKELRSLKSERDFVAHVNEIEFDSEKSYFFAKKILEYIEVIQKAHTKQFLSDLEDTELFDNVLPSKIDIGCYLNLEIDRLIESKSFSIATRHIENLKKYFDDIKNLHIKKILEKVFNNPHTLNQILECDAAPRFLLQLFTKDNIDLLDWKDFETRLNKYFETNISSKKNYKKLLEKFVILDDVIPFN